ncbi:MAG: hypothetical protein IKA85_05645 [Clostridia bacterium]|nr:hypothetical protein [Clostridia bacterium]
MTVFLKRSASCWSSSIKNKYFSAIDKASDFLMKEAKRYGVSLNIAIYNLETNVPATADPLDGYDIVKDYFHRDTVEELQDYYEEKMGVDEVPIILAFNESGRSFAYRQKFKDKYEVQELSILFYHDKTNHAQAWKTIAHELLHQFGASDYYFPQEVEKIAKKYFTDSIMGIGKPVVDDFTAYIIGWKDTISANTYWFLKETMWMNEKEFKKALDDAWNM